MDEATARKLAKQKAAQIAEMIAALFATRGNDLPLEDKILLGEMDKAMTLMVESDDLDAITTSVKKLFARLLEHSPRHLDGIQEQTLLVAEKLVEIRETKQFVKTSGHFPASDIEKLSELEREAERLVVEGCIRRVCAAKAVKMIEQLLQEDASW